MDESPKIAVQGEFVEKMLSGSQAKTAFALRQNIERMLAGNSPLVLRKWTDTSGTERESWVATKPENLNCAAFLTITVGDSWTKAAALKARDKADRARQAALVKNAKASALVRFAECLRLTVKENRAAEKILSKRGNKLAAAERRQREAYRVAAMVPDDGESHFVQVWDAAEASRRINNLRKYLLTIFERAVIVTERHKNKAIHFHIVGTLNGKPDIRTGFDFAAFKAARDARDAGKVNRTAEMRYKLASSPALSALWASLRGKLPGYHFGRAELTPIERTGEAVACYVAKYVEKNVCQRIPEDKRKKLVRYWGEWGTVLAVERPDRFAERIEWIEAAAAEKLPITLFGLPPAGCWKLRPNDFAWAGRRAWAWWNKAAELSGLVSWETTSKVGLEIGPRWAFKLANIWKEHCGDDLTPALTNADTAKRRELRGALIQEQAAFKSKVCTGWSSYRRAGELERLAADWKPVGDDDDFPAAALALPVACWTERDWQEHEREVEAWDAGRDARRARLEKFLPRKRGVIVGAVMNCDDIFKSAVGAKN